MRPIVPPQYGKSEMHAVVLLKQTPVAALAGVSPLAPMPPHKGVEFARFGNQLVIVNHRSCPVDIRRIPARQLVAQLPSAPGWLGAIRRSAWNYPRNLFALAAGGRRFQ